MRENFELLVCLIDQFESKYGEDGRCSLADPAFGRHFSDLVLLGLIRAARRTNDFDVNAERKRLSKAHKEIFGFSPDQKANDGDDQDALVWMAEMMDIRCASGKATSVSSLAARARGEGGHPGQSSANHLRTKFPEFYEEWQSKDHDKIVEIQTIQHVACDLIEEIMMLFGVPFLTDL